MSENKELQICVSDERIKEKITETLYMNLQNWAKIAR